ncbi:IS30 family transposase [Megasphaera sp. SW808]|uniref:IS30 family transposase n=1 Tax=Megasphaera sp. SW808 TaxID=2530045 RepID=UPI003211E7AE
MVKDLFLIHHWSPAEIAGRLRLEHHQCVISYNTIYRAIYAGEFDDKPLSHGNRGAVRNLRPRGKSHHTRTYTERQGSIVISHDISERPIGAENRSWRGHWECDTVLGKQGKACLVTLVDRKSRYLLGDKAAKKNAQAVNEVMLRELNGQPLRSLTPDQGKEFANHAAVTEALEGVQFYFPPPHQPWQRDSNENTNGLLREYFPKGMDLTPVSETYIQQVFAELNLRPRMCLGYKPPYEVCHSKKLHLA